MGSLTSATDRPATARWGAPAVELSETSLRSLMAGEVRAIRLGEFATTDECRQLRDAVLDATEQAHAAVTAQMNLFGVNFSNIASDDKGTYFGLVEPSYREVGALTSAARFDPLARMMERLRAVWPNPLGIASEPGFGRYFAGGIKTRVAGSNLHYDFAPHSAADYAIGQVVDQLGWNLYIEMPANTGHTITYDHAVPREGGAMGSGGGRALDIDRDWVSGVEPFNFRPRVGEVIIINTRYPHEVIVDGVADGEIRAQASSFIGRLPCDALILWS